MNFEPKPPYIPVMYPSLRRYLPGDVNGNYSLNTTDSGGNMGLQLYRSETSDFVCMELSASHGRANITVSLSAAELMIVAQMCVDAADDLNAFAPATLGKRQSP